MTFNDTISTIVENLHTLFDTTTEQKELTIQPLQIRDDLFVHAKIYPVQCKTFVDWELYADIRRTDGTIERGWGYSSYSLGMYADMKHDEDGLKELLGSYFDHGKVVKRHRHWDCDERGFEYWETLVIYEDGYSEWVDFERGDLY